MTHLLCPYHHAHCYTTDMCQAMLKYMFSCHKRFEMSQRVQLDVQEEESKGGFLKTLFNAVNILCGVGLLATPYAAAQMGWASLLLLLVLGMHTSSAVRAANIPAAGLLDRTDSRL